MNEEQFRHFLGLADQRDEKRYAWLRHLLLLASGSLTLLVSLRAGGSPMGTVALWSMRVAWPALGLGILLLAVALHGDVWTADALVRKAAAELRTRPSAPGPSIATRPWPYALAERGAYACLATTVVALVVHGLTR